MSRLTRSAARRPSRVAGLSTPVLGPLLADRRLSAVLAAAGAAQVALTWAHVGGWPCPFLALTGRPCPGCGLSRACAAACRGRVHDAVQLHAFAPLFLLAISLFAVAAIAPARLRLALAAAVSGVERRWAATNLLLVLLLLYWVLRIGYASAEVARVTSPAY